MLNPALYYPYIHFRDVKWLKVSLLCFQQIRRIVPQEFALNDSDEVRQLREQKGVAKEPLIREEPASTGAVWTAQERLLKRLQDQPPRFLKQFTLERTKQGYPSDDQAFEMHRGKMMPLVDFLRGKKLAWPAVTFRQNHPDDWLALHPKLGEVIMSTIAVALAKENGLGIVTSSGEVHRALVEQKEELIFEMLTEQTPADAAPLNMTDELAMVVLSTAFDVSKLNAKQIAELVREGHDLSRFKKRLDDELRDARAIPSAKERRRRLEAAAADIISEWKKHRKSLPKYAFEALLPLGDEKMSTVATGVIAGATGMLTLGVGVGLAIGYTSYAGVRAWRKYKESEMHPLNYLSKIHKQGAILVAQA